MILFALATFLIISYFYSSKTFVYALMVFFVLFDMFDGFYEDEKIFAAIRYIVPLVLLTHFILKEGVFEGSDFIIITLGLYLLILLVYSEGDIIISAKTSIAVLLTLLMIPVGRAVGRRADFLKEFEGFNRFLLVILPLYIIMANIFRVGESYSEAFTTGYLITSRFYIVPIVVFLAIHYVISEKDKSAFLKGIDIGFILLNVCIIIINTRRTALGMLVLALFVYTLLNRKIIFRMAVLSLFVIAALIVSYPLYEDMLMAQLEERERIQDLDTYEEEGRYLETLYIFDYHNRRQNVADVLFGVKLFDTTDFGARYFGRDRPIHSDLNMIFYSTGLVGVCLFLILFLRYFAYGNDKVAPEKKRVYYPLLIMFLITLLPGRFIGTLTYAPLLMLALSAIKAWQSSQVRTVRENEFATEAIQ